VTKILLIDDDNFYSEYVSLSLQLIGLDVTCAETAEAGLELLDKDSDYDIAIIDGLLPGMNGIELCKTIRKQSQFNDMKIIIASGLDRSKIELNIEDTPIERHLKKPFTIDKLTLAIEELVDPA
jgi:DNA-binding response OmpR family regulator